MQQPDVAIHRTATRGVLGVLGGMGPLATVDFLRKIVAATPARVDQEHVPVVAFSIPQIPDRSACLIQGADSPLPRMLDILQLLVAAGAERIAIPCNTAHHWHEALSVKSSVPVFHMTRETAAALRASHTRHAVLFATAGTMKSGHYARELLSQGLTLLPIGNDLQTEVSAAIALTKAGEIEQAGKLMDQACRKVRAAGAERIILGCTELPLCLQAIGSPQLQWCIDPTDILARACIAWSLGHRATQHA